MLLVGNIRAGVWHIHDPFPFTFTSVITLCNNNKLRNAAWAWHDVPCHDIGFQTKRRISISLLYMCVWFRLLCMCMGGYRCNCSLFVLPLVGLFSCSNLIFKPCKARSRSECICTCTWICMDPIERLVLVLTPHPWETRRKFGAFVDIEYSLLQNVFDWKNI